MDDLVDASHFTTRFLRSQTAPDEPAVDDFRLRGSPYPGLRSFNPQEGSVFFGREQNVDEIRDRLADLHIAVVLGGSGSGKSSVVRAGLIPRLNSTKGIRGRSGNWYAAEFRPRLRPMDELAGALADLVCEQFPDQGSGPDGQPGRPDRGEMAARLKACFGGMNGSGRAEGAGPRETTAAAVCDALFDFVATELNQRDCTATKGLRAGRPNLLLVVDQFEEIFRPEVAGEPTSGGTQLLDLLLAAFARLEREQHMRSDARSGLFIVVTMRSEELHRCTEHPSLRSTFGEESVHRSLADMVNRSAYLLDLFDPVQDRAALREAIIYPARRMFQDWGLPIDTSSCDAPFARGVPDWLIEGAKRLSTELEHRPDQLPLLQHALQTMWQCAIADWARQTNRTHFLIRHEHLVSTSVEAICKAPDLSACLDKRANDTARDAAGMGDKSLTANIDYRESLHPSLQPGLGKAATRAAFRALAQRDDRGNWVRRFATLGEIMVFMQADPVTAELSEEAKEACVRAALSVFVNRGYLVEKNGQYDISHEALIRNWKVFQDWLRQPEEVAQTLTRLVSDLDPASLDGPSNETKRQLLLVNFPPPVREKVGTVLHSRILPMEWAVEQVVPLLKRPTVARRWAAATGVKGDDPNRDRMTARATLERLGDFASEAESAQKRLDEERAQAQRQAEKNKRNQRRLRIGGSAVVLFVMLAIIGSVIVQIYAGQRAFVERLMTFAQHNSSPNFRQRILLLLHALEESNGRLFLDPRFPREALRTTLARSPNFGGTYTAVGFNASGTKLAILDGENLTVHDLSTRISAPPLQVRWPPPEGSPAHDGASSIFGEPYIAGFVDHPERGEIPAVYRYGILVYWDEQEPQSIDLRPLLPKETGANLRAELVGAVRVTINTQRNPSSSLRGTRFIEFGLVREANGSLGVRISTPEWPVPAASSRFLTTISAKCRLYGYLDTQNVPSNLFVGTLGQAEPPSKLALDESGVQDEAPGSSFVQAISFSADCETVTVRQNIDRLTIVPIEPVEGGVRFSNAVRQIKVPAPAQDVVHPLFGRFRPLLASSRTAQGLRFSWLTRNGITVVDVKDEASEGQLLFDLPILVGLDNAVKIQFSEDGTLLTLLQQGWGVDTRAKTRAWDFSRRRLDEIPQGGDGLVAEACRIAKQENGSETLEPSERKLWLTDENAPSPCSKVSPR